jgi:hypothetical protein
MNHCITDIDGLVQRLLDDDANLAIFDEVSGPHGVAFNEVCNAAALAVAHRFRSGVLIFSDADLAMNRLFAIMVNDMNRQPQSEVELAEPAYSLYCAFDAGEYDHGDGKDPVETITRPEVQRLIRDA